MSEVEDKIPEEIYDDIRKQLSIMRNRFKTKFRDKSLAEQRQSLKNYLRGLLVTNELPDELIDTEELKSIIEDFLFYQVERPKDVYAQDWVPWLTKSRKASISWKYSDRYFKYLIGVKKWKEKAASTIDVSTDDILNHCGDPKSDHDFEIKGLVIGDIQSGKTANYTALINKAVDAGYKIIIVLTGTTNDLRSQTQKRLDKEAVGFKTDFNDDETGDQADDLSNGYGVGQIDVLDRLQVLTNASIDGDLKKNIGLYQIGPDSSCFLAVIKKNKSSLNAIINFLKKCQASQMDPDKKMPYPVLMIDDEADLASVNTSKTQEIDESTGTNRLIRTILFKTCRKFTYVGYTATPFANVFIKPHDKNLAEGDIDDIFPDDFIITLPTPEDYCGPFQYFGIDKNTQDDDSQIRTDLLVPVSEEDMKSFCGYQDPDLPPGQQECTLIPDSLRTAVMCFLISTGVKISRGIIENYTMLVNVNVRVKFNETLRDEVRQIFEYACKSFNNDAETRANFKAYWEQNMKPISEARLAEVGIPFTDHWDGPDGIEESIRKAIKLKKADTVKLIVGTSSADVLDYSKSKQGIFVCVGGQKLSRGLTLEGLSVSYYGRNAHALDTLLQMGRWFGYRKGWLDLCRVFTTPKIAEDYIDAAITTEGFKRQIAIMHENHATPRTFGLKVLIANEKLKPTSPTKSRFALKVKVSFSASLSQLLDFRKSATFSNLALVKRFIHEHEASYKPRANFNRPVFRNIGVDKILPFLKSFSCPSSAIPAWIEYIKRCNQVGELLNWTVIISSNDTDPTKIPPEKTEDIDGHIIGKPDRTIRIQGESSDLMQLRALTSPKDYIGFFPDGVTPDENGYDPENDDVIKRYYTPDNCIMVIYVIDIHKRKEQGDTGKFGKVITDGGQSAVGLGIWFPKSNLFKPEYSYANPVEVERIYNGESNPQDPERKEKTL
ncbi:MAG: Z1 domain-containing protein [Erysipelotrichaceae bacterium]|nr:Z1 domain-containing protein [Erysipelotrichaceae bacterium]